MAYDSLGKSLPGPSPEFVAWATAHNLDADALGEQQVYWAAGPVRLLAITGDPRSIPLLRRALLSPNYMIEIAAAMGLAEIHDDSSVPMIIEACKKAPAEVAEAMARSLVYFDGSDAQNAVDQFIPKDDAKMLRDNRARGKKPFSN